MQRLGGLLLIAAGVSLGAYTFLPPAFDGEQNLREVTRISAAPDRQHAVAGWADSEVAASGETTVVKTPGPTPVKVASASADAPSDKPAATWSAIVMSEAGQQPRITSSKPGDDETRVQLTRDLQSELKRVGCYAGDINGMWTPSTKRAMSTFMDRVNASLPIDDPDYILLTLVQGHSAKACGAGCPAGQTASADGRCLPQAVVAARDARKIKSTQDVAMRDRQRDNAAQDRLAALSQPTAPVAPAAPTAPRGKAAGLSEDELASLNLPAREPERLPWQDDDLSAPAITAVPQPQRAVRRPEGMMAVGAANVSNADIAETVPAQAAPRRMVPVGTLQDIPRIKTAPVLGSGSEAYEPGLPGTKAGPAIPRIKGAAVKPGKRSKQAKARPAAPVVAAKPAKPKLLYYAGSGRRGQIRPGSPAFNMLQAMGGVY